MCILMYADDSSLACDTAEKLRVAVTTMDSAGDLQSALRRPKCWWLAETLQLKL